MQRVIGVSGQKFCHVQDTSCVHVVRIRGCYFYGFGYISYIYTYICSMCIMYIYMFTYNFL